MRLEDIVINMSVIGAIYPPGRSPVYSVDEILGDTVNVSTPAGIYGRFSYYAVPISAIEPCPPGYQGKQFEAKAGDGLFKGKVAYPTR